MVATVKNKKTCREKVLADSIVLVEKIIARDKEHVTEGFGCLAKIIARLYITKCEGKYEHI